MSDEEDVEPGDLFKALLIIVGLVSFGTILLFALLAK